MKSPLELARERETRLAQGLRDLAAKHGKTFKEPLAIDSRGEFNLFIELDPPRPGFPGACGQYGDSLAAIISPHSPRCGMAPGAHIDGQQGWCMMHHFDVERMLSKP